MHDYITSTTSFAWFVMERLPFNYELQITIPSQ